MKKNARELDAIAADIHLRGRTNIIAVGRLLNEAHEACKHGDWGQWLNDEFEWSGTTADRFRAVATLAELFPKLGKLQLAPTTLYAIVDLAEEAQPDVIDELAKHASKVFLKAPDAAEIIDRVVLARQYGDLPFATLYALDNLITGRPWSDKAAEALKRDQPTTNDDAEKITIHAQRGYVDSLYAAYGGLPPVPGDSLYFLEGLAEDRRARMVERLRAAPQPLSADDVLAISFRRDDDGGDGVGGDDAPDDGDDDHGDDGDGDAPAASPDYSLPDEPVVTAIKTILAFASHGPQAFRAGCKSGGVSSVDLIAAANFLSSIAATLAGNNAARIADRAEARGRANREAQARP
jgi:hypothetical protein